MPGGTNLPVLGDLGRSSQTPYPYDAYPQNRKDACPATTRVRIFDLT